MNEISEDSEKAGAGENPPKGGVGTAKWPSCAELGKREDLSFSKWHRYFPNIPSAQIIRQDWFTS